MILTLQEIIHQLHNDWIDSHYFHTPTQDVHGFKFYTPTDTSFDPHYIYIVYNDSLQSQVTGTKTTAPLPQTLCLLPTSQEALHTLKEKIAEKDGENNLIFCSPSLDLTLFVNRLSELFAGNYELVKRPAALFNTIIQGRGLSYILKIAGELLGNPVLLGDTNHRLLAASDYTDIDDASWTEFRNIGYSTYAYTQKYGFKYWIDQTVKSGKPIIGTLSESHTYRRIFAAVTIENHVVGHLAVLEYQRPFTEKDLEITEFLCTILASEIRAHYQQDMGTLVTGRFLLDLLEQHPISTEHLQHRLHKLAIAMPDRLQVIALQFTHYSDHFAAISYLRELKGDLRPITDIVHYENRLIFIIEATTSDSPSNPLFTLMKELNQSPLLCGVSQPYHKITDTHAYYAQSIKAITLGRQFNPDASIHFYENLAIMDLIQDIHKTVPLNHYIHSSIRTLKQYDLEHNTPYLDSLFTYIVHMCHIVSSADALHIHRNTMTYRLNKIQELIPVDWNNKDHLMNLYFSCKLLDYMDSYSE